MDHTFSMFSASGLSKLNVRDLVPDYNTLFPDYFKSKYQPTVVGKLGAEMQGIALYQGNKFVHNVKNPDSTAKGAVMILNGPKSDMETWIGELDEFEEAFGMKRAAGLFDITGGHYPATYYFLEKLEDIGDKDGLLKKL